MYFVTWSDDGRTEGDGCAHAASAQTAVEEPRNPHLRRTLLRPPRDRLPREDHEADHERGDLARLLALRIALGRVELVEECVVLDELLELGEGFFARFDAHPHRAVHRVAQNDAGQVEEQRHVVCEPVVKVKEHVTNLVSAQRLVGLQAAPENKVWPPRVVERLRRARVVVERMGRSLVFQRWRGRILGGTTSATGAR